MSKGELNKRESEEIVIRTASTHDCGGRCPLRVHVRDGVVTRVEAAIGEGAQISGLSTGACLRQRLYRLRVYRHFGSSAKRATKYGSDEYRHFV